MFLVEYKEEKYNLRGVFPRKFIALYDYNSFEFNTMMTKAIMQNENFNYLGKAIKYYKSFKIYFELNPFKLINIKSFNRIKCVDSNNKKNVVSLDEYNYPIVNDNRMFLFQKIEGENNKLNEIVIKYNFFLDYSYDLNQCLFSKEIKNGKVIDIFSKSYNTPNSLTDEYYKMFIKQLKKYIFNYKNSVNSKFDEILALSEVK
jgi:hypothetical protein